MEPKFDLNFINKISKHCYGVNPSSIKRFHSENNFIFLLKFKDTKKVIKIDKGQEGWKVDKELYLFKILKKHEIPVPKIEHFDISKKLIPYDWYIMENLGDHNLNELFLKKERDVKDLFFELGEILAKIHNIKFKEQGLIFAGDIEKKSFYASHKQSFDSGIKNLLDHKKITKREEILLKDAFKDFKDSNEKRLCPDDFAPWQAIVNKNKIQGIIDLEWARSSDPIYDLSKTELLMSIWSGNIDIFEKGYRSINSLPKNYESLKKTYQIVEVINLMNYFISNDQTLNKGKKILLKLLHNSHIINL